MNGLKREQLIALNSTLLHELCFASLGGDGKPPHALADVLARDFGSVDRWRGEFVAKEIAKGATWRDPDRIQEWIGELSKSEPVVVYCAYGFHVGCGTAVKLREAGFDASYMKPGHSGSKALGRPLRMNV